ncbi:hypothetical protein ACT1U9_15080 [Streptomyces sp. BR1]|uniref:hypothetical protein n=1 Tax=Streptomyces sp. BR1 TaxID=1592323 RepID=UPI00402B5CF8
MSTYTARRRVAVRAAIATAALAGTFLTPSAALAATPAGASAATGTDKCTAVTTIPSVHAGMTVTLTNSLKQGPKAALKDGKGKVVATVDKTHVKDMEAGIAITGTSLAVPTFNQWLKGGGHATKNTPFPKMPGDCGKDLGGETAYKLVNGETVTVAKFSPGHYRAEFVTNGHVVLILGTENEGEEGVDGYVHGMHVALSATTGKLRSEFIHTRSGCTVTEVARSAFGWGFSVKLTNGPSGWKAEQRDANLKVMASADRTHPNAGLGMGLKITGGDTATPKLGQRTQGGDTPYMWSSFPTMPKGCATTAKPTTSTTSTTSSTDKTPTSAPSADSAGQTTIVPKGAVAAGAEIKEQGTSDRTALYAGGTAATALGAAGFTLLRRRRMNRV